MSTRSLVIVVGVCAVLVILAVVLIPKAREGRCEGRSAANRAVSMTNIRTIDQALYSYAGDNNGTYPSSLDVLVKSGLMPASVLINPSRPKLKVGYVYIKPVVDLDIPVLMIYEAFDEWDRGVMTNLGLISDEKLFKKVLAEIQQGDGPSTETMKELSEISSPFSIKGTPR